MLSPEIIGAIRVLLARVQISGAEVSSFNKIIQALDAEERAQKVSFAVPPQAVAE